MNTVNSSVRTTKTRISSLAGGTLVMWEGAVYIVLTYNDNPAHIGAVNIADGGYLCPETVVEVIAAGETVEVTAGPVKYRS